MRVADEPPRVAASDAGRWMKARERTAEAGRRPGEQRDAGGGRRR